jgi:aspartyl-tRNA(Asn)/glutamyl-tRNA(Gln) amidotransferase subunit C
MKIGENEVRHVARLAELAVADADVPLLAVQLAGIVEFVAQLDQVTTPETSGAAVVGPGRVPLRADIINPIPMGRTPAQMAPVFQQGFYVVPRLDGMSGE